MNHNHQHHQHHDTTRNILFAFVLNLSFTLLEIVGGLWTNSLAILSDALHDLGDSISLGLSWYLERYSQKGRDHKFSYGYRRFSLLAALLNTIVLIVGSIIILAEAIPRIMDPQTTNARGMIIFALFGIGVNGLAVLRLRGEKSMNAQVVAWHLLEDVLGWVAVLIVSVVLLFTDYYFLDPVLAIIVTTYVVLNMLRNLRKTAALFLQAVPENVNLDLIDKKLNGIDLVLSTHHTHVWSLDGAHHVLTTHVVLDKCATREDMLRVKNNIKRLSEDWHFEHTTIEFEFEDNDCSMG